MYTFEQHQRYFGILVCVYFEDNLDFGYSIGSMQEEETRDKAKIILCDNFKERS